MLSHAARDAASRYGTPCYLYDLARLDADAARIRTAFPDPWLRLYSLKANGLPALIDRLPAAGYGATVVSAGEIASLSERDFRRAGSRWRVSARASPSSGPRSPRHVRASRCCG